MLLFFSYANERMLWWQQQRVVFDGLNQYKSTKPVNKTKGTELPRGNE